MAIPQQFLTAANGGLSGGECEVHLAWELILWNPICPPYQVLHGSQDIAHTNMEPGILSKMLNNGARSVAARG